MSGASNDRVDPDELLHRLRPHADAEYLAPGSDPHAESLLQRVTSREVERPRPAR